MATSLEAIRRLSLQAELIGEARVVSGLGQIAQAQGDVAAAGEVMARSVDKTAKSAENAQRGYERFQRSVNPLQKDVDLLARGLGQLERAWAAGIGIDSAAKDVAMLLNATRAAKEEMQAAAAAEKEWLREVAAEAKRAAAERIAAQEAVTARLVQDNEQIKASMLASLAAQGEAYDRLEREAKQRATEEEAAIRRVDEAMADYTRKAERRANDVIAYEERKTQELKRLRDEQAAIASQASYNAILGVDRPAATTQGATSSALREAAEQQDRLTRASHTYLELLQPLAQAQQRHAAAIADINEMQRLGILTREQAVRAMSLENDKLKVIERNLGADGVAGALKLQSYQWINLGHQMNDIVSGVLMGQSPFMIMAQQGGQVYQILSGAQGGLTGGLQAVRDRLLSLLTPTTAFAAATVALGAAAAYAAYSWSKLQQEIELALIGVGRGAGVTVGDINRIGEALARTSDLSVSQATRITAALAATGKIAQENLGPIAQLARGYSMAFGADLNTTGQKLGEIFADPVKGADELNKRLGFLTDRTREYIRTLVDQGDRQRAIAVLIKEVQPELQRAADLTSGWARAWRTVSNVVSDVLDKVGKSLFPGAEESLKAVQEQIRVLQTIRGAPGAGRNETAQIDARIAVMQKLAVDLEAKVAASKADLEQRDAAHRARAITEQLLPAIPAYDALIAKQTQLNKALADRDTLHNAGAMGVALNKVQNAIRDYNDAGGAMGLASKRLAEGLKLQEEAVNATTVAQVADIAARRKALELYGTETSQAERREQIEAARKEAVIEATKAIEQQSRAIQQSVDVSKAEADALAQTGEAAAMLARARAQAAADVQSGRAVDVDRRAAEILREQIANLNRERAASTAAMRQETETQEALNRAIKSGQMTVSEATARQQLWAERSKLIAAASVAEGEQAEQLKKRIDDLTKAYEGGLSAKAKFQALSMIEDQKRTLGLIELEISLIGKSTLERERAIAAYRTQQDLIRQNIPLASEEGRLILANARALAERNVALDKAREAHQQFIDAQREMTQAIATVLGAFVSSSEKIDKAFAKLGPWSTQAEIAMARINREIAKGTGELNDALKGIGKTVSTNFINAIVTGSGPFAGALGLAGEKGQPGGIFAPDFFDRMQKVFTRGTSDGFLNVFGGNRGALQGPNPDGSTLDVNPGGFPAGGGLGLGHVAMGAGALIGSYGAGYSGGPLMGGLMGAVSGAMAGAMIGSVVPVIGTAIGAVAGAVLGGAAGIFGGVMGQRDQQRQQRLEMIRQQMEAQQALAQAMPQIEALRTGFRGDNIGQIAQARQAGMARASEAAAVAAKAQDWATSGSIWADFQTFTERLDREFREAFGGMVDALNAGLGPDSPFIQARDHIKQIGDALKGFVADAASAGASVDEARAASLAYAKTLLEGERSLSAVETRMQEITGGASALAKVLQDLGMSSAEAADEVDRGVSAAIRRLRTSFQDDLVRGINEGLNENWRNDIADLVSRVSGLRSDAAALGADPALVERYLAVQAQKIVDSARLTGDAFAELVEAFPGLRGVVKAFVDEIGIAARVASFLDRAFNAIQDVSTLEGALAVFDRKAMREREAEIRSGGEAMAELEQALQAERLSIQRDFADKQIKEQRRIADEAQKFFENLTRTITAFIARLKTGPVSPLSPVDQLAFAQTTYNQQLALAQGGNREALSGITGYAQQVIDAARAVYASAPAYQAIFNQIVSQLEALPNVAQQADPVVLAIEEMRDVLRAAIDAGNAQQVALALAPKFDTLTSTTGGLLNFTQFQAGVGPLAKDGTVGGLLTQAQLDALGLSRDTTTGALVSISNTLSKDATVAGLLTQAQMQSLGLSSNATVEAARQAILTTNSINSGLLTQAQIAALGLSKDQTVGSLLTQAQLSALGLSTNSTLEQARQAIVTMDNGRLAAIFNEIDVNGDGTINRLESLISAEGTTRSVLKAAIDAGNASAIATALAPHFDAIDIDASGGVTFQEFQQLFGSVNGNLQAIFNELDANGDGQISKLELIRAATEMTEYWTWQTKSATDLVKQATDAAKAAVDAVGSLQSSANSLQSTANGLINTQIGILDQVRSLNETMKDQLTQNQTITPHGNTVSNNMLVALNKIVWNTHASAMNLKNILDNGIKTINTGFAFSNSVSSVFAHGGWVGGQPHSMGGTIIEAERGEYVVNARSAARYGPLLEAINDNRPVALAGGGGDVVSAVRALHGEVAALRRENAAMLSRLGQIEADGHAMVAGTVQKAVGKLADETRIAGARPKRTGTNG